MSDSSGPPVLRTLVLALLALVLVLLAGQLVGARVALSAGEDLGVNGVAIAGGLTVLALCLTVPLSLAGRLIGALSSRKPHRPTLTLASLVLWNAAVLGVMVGVFPTRSAEALRAHADWIPGTAGTPLTQGSSLVAGLIPGAEAGPGLVEEPAQDGVAKVVDADGEPEAGDEAVGAPVQKTAPPPFPWTPDQLFAQRADAVVVIQTRAPVDEEHPLADMLRAFGMEGLEGHGSGFVVDGEQGLVVTNHHVIGEAGQATVRLRDGRHLGPVTIVASDAANDLALVQVPVDEALPEAPLAEAGAVPVGSRTWAIGAPLGLEYTFTEGIVSGHRDMQGTSFLQMQTTIAPGSSGGPLFDDHGRVVGVNTATRSSGLNFAVQVDHVHELLDLERAAEAVALEEYEPGYEVVKVELSGAELHPTTRQGIADVAEMLGRKTMRCFDEVPADLEVGAWIPTSIRVGDVDLRTNMEEVDQDCLERDLGLLSFALRMAQAQESMEGPVSLYLDLERQADQAHVRLALHLGGDAAPELFLPGEALDDGASAAEAPVAEAQEGRSDQDQSASSTSAP